MKKKIGVIFGGNSVEHEISIISALQAVENLNKDKYEIFPIYISKQQRWYCDKSLFDINNFKNMDEINKLNEVYLSNDDGTCNIKYKKNNLFKNNIVTEIDLFLPIVHGTSVEDGKLQGYLETIGAKYCGPDVYSAVVGQDKAYMKDIFKANNVNQLDYIWVTDNMNSNEVNKLIIDTINYPVILKPSLLGSSVGIEVVRSEDELEEKLTESFKYCYKVLVEKFCEEFTEVNISVLGNYKDINLSTIEQVSKGDEILSYDDKYKNNSKSKSSGMASLDRIIPAPLTDEIKAKVEETAKHAFYSLCGRGLCRIDMMIIDNNVYVNEINNIPGSLAFYLWDDYSDLLDKLIEYGVNKFFDDQKKQFSFETNVLELSSKGSKS